MKLLNLVIPTCMIMAISGAETGKALWSLTLERRLNLVANSLEKARMCKFEHFI